MNVAIERRPRRQRAASARPRRLHDRGDGEPLRKLVKHDRGEHDRAEGWARDERRPDRDAVHERVQREAQDRRARDVRIDDAVGVRFRAEVQVRGEDVLEEMVRSSREDVQRRGLAPTLMIGMRSMTEREKIAGAERITESACGR